MSRQGHDSLQQISKARDECFSLISNYAFPRRASNPLLSYLLKFWCRFQDLNLGQLGYQPSPLPTEVNLHIKNGNFKLVGVSSIQLFRAVDLALHRATFYPRPDLPITGVSYVWRWVSDSNARARYKLAQQISSLRPYDLLGNPPNMAEVFVLCAVPYGALKDCYDDAIRCTRTLLLIVDSPPMRFSLREFHLLCCRINNSWQRAQVPTLSG